MKVGDRVTLTPEKLAEFRRIYGNSHRVIEGLAESCKVTEVLNKRIMLIYEDKDEYRMIEGEFSLDWFQKVFHKSLNELVTK